MKDLLFSVCTASLFASAVGFLCPSGNEGVSKTLRLLLSLCICACLIFPTMRLLKSDVQASIELPNIEESAKTESLDTMIDGTIKTICDEIEDYISKTYEITNPKLTLVSDRSDPSRVRIVKGHLDGNGRLEEAAGYISGLLSCKITCGEG